MNTSIKLQTYQSPTSDAFVTPSMIIVTRLLAMVSISVASEGSSSLVDEVGDGASIVESVMGVDWEDDSDCASTDETNAKSSTQIQKPPCRRSMRKGKKPALRDQRAGYELFIQKLSSDAAYWENGFRE